MRLRALIFSFVCALACSNLDAQAPASQASRPAILGDFQQGRYSNTILGLTLDLPANWQIDNLDESESYSRSLPRRMRLHFGSSEGLLLLNASPVGPDEKLAEVFGVSLMGARDGGGFDVAGKEVTTNIDGCEVLSQKLRRKSKAGDQFGVYRGFFSHGYYVSILHFGPQSTQEAREAILSSLHIH